MECILAGEEDRMERYGKSGDYTSTLARAYTDWIQGRAFKNTWDGKGSSFEQRMSLSCCCRISTCLFVC